MASIETIKTSQCYNHQSSISFIIEINKMYQVVKIQETESYKS